MGFNAGLCVLRPNTFDANWASREPPFRGSNAVKEVPKKMITQWSIVSVISFGEVTRMEKLVSPQYRHLSFDAMKRAGICAASILLRHLGERLSRMSGSEQVVPRVFTDKLQIDFSGLRDGEQYALIQTASRLGFGEMFPSKTINAHNSLVLQSDWSFANHIREDYSVVTDPPFLWESLDEVVVWLDAVGSEAFTEEHAALGKDAVAGALFDAWKVYLGAVRGLGWKVIFVFPPYGSGLTFL